LKPSLVYGQLPFMTVDGTTLAQSMAIARYLAREYGLNGASNLDNAQADEIVDVINDMQQAIVSSLHLRIFTSAKDCFLLLFCY